MTRWIAPVLKEELMKDGCVRKDIDYDYYAYLLSLTEVIPVDCGTRKGLEMEEFFFLGYQYMRISRLSAVILLTSFERTRELCYNNSSNIV